LSIKKGVASMMIEDRPIVIAHADGTLIEAARERWQNCCDRDDTHL
jgi:hypothetical protein